MEENLKLIEKLDCQQGAVRAVRFNTDGDYVITCGSNKTIRLWTSVISKELNNQKRPKLLTTYAGHGNEVLDARGSCDNGQIVSCGLDKAVILWDVGSGKVLRYVTRRSCPDIKDIYYHLKYLELKFYH